MKDVSRRGLEPFPSGFANECGGTQSKLVIAAEEITPAARDRTGVENTRPMGVQPSQNFWSNRFFRRESYHTGSRLPATPTSKPLLSRGCGFKPRLAYQFYFDGVDESATPLVVVRQAWRVARKRGRIGCGGHFVDLAVQVRCRP
jgi:hypothetical protein